MTTLLFLAVALPAADATPPVDARTEALAAFAAVTQERIRLLESNLFEIVIDSREMEMADGSIAYECVSADKVSRCVWFRPDQEIPKAGPFVVRGSL